MKKDQISFGDLFRAMGAKKAILCFEDEDGRVKASEIGCTTLEAVGLAALFSQFALTGGMKAQSDSELAKPLGALKH